MFPIFFPTFVMCVFMRLDLPLMFPIFFPTFVMCVLILGVLICPSCSLFSSLCLLLCVSLFYGTCSVPDWSLFCSFQNIVLLCRLIFVFTILLQFPIHRVFVYVCVCVCVHACMHVCVLFCCLFLLLLTYKCTHTHTLHTCINSQTHTFKHTHSYTHAHTHTHTHTHTRTLTHITMAANSGMSV